MHRPDGLQVGQYHWVFHFADGRLRRLSVYGDRDEALASLAALNAIAPPPPEFAVEVGEPAGGVRTLRPTGELDIATAPELERVLERPRAAGDRVVLDLAELEFIDSTGLRVIVRARRGRATRALGAAAAPRAAAVRRVFDISGVPAPSRSRTS